MNDIPNVLPSGPDESGPLTSKLSNARTQESVRALMESPLVPKIQGWMNRCGDPTLKVEQLATLAAEAAGLLTEAQADPNAAILADVVRLTRVFLISRQGSSVALQTQGEWRMSLGEMESGGGWKGMLASWNSGKLDSQLAGGLPAAQQITFLRQSLDGFLRAARHGVQQLPMTMPVVGAEVDASILQTPDQKGTPMVDRLPPPRRLVSALAVTVAYAEQERGNDDEVAKLLAIADEQQRAGSEEFKDAHFLRLNLAISGLIADGAVRKGGDQTVIEAYLAELAAAPGISDFKKTEWSAHAHALLALATGDAARIEDCFRHVEKIAAERPQFMEIIAIEPTFKELTKRFPAVKGRMDALIAKKDRA